MRECRQMMEMSAERVTSVGKELWKVQCQMSTGVGLSAVWRWLVGLVRRGKELPNERIRG